MASSSATRGTFSSPLSPEPLALGGERLPAAALQALPGWRATARRAVHGWNVRAPAHPVAPSPPCTRALIHPATPHVAQRRRSGPAPVSQRLGGVPAVSYALVARAVGGADRAAGAVRHD